MEKKEKEEKKAETRSITIDRICMTVNRWVAVNDYLDRQKFDRRNLINHSLNQRNRNRVILQIREILRMTGEKLIVDVNSLNGVNLEVFENFLSSNEKYFEVPSTIKIDS